MNIKGLSADEMMSAFLDLELNGTVMELNIFNMFRDNADLNGILFYYNGQITQNVILTMGDSLKQRLKEDALLDSPQKAKKLFSSFIEMTQNALHYSPDISSVDEGKSAAIAVGTIEDSYFIVCGNLIKNEYIEHIKTKLDPLLNMTMEDIKKAYREQLKNDQHETEDAISKGAGLGLLTIARDASKPMEYSITPVECRVEGVELANFFLKVTI